MGFVPGIHDVFEALSEDFQLDDLGTFIEIRSTSFDGNVKLIKLNSGSNIRLSNEPTAHREYLIWEDQWHRNPLVVASRIKALMGKSERIHARECQVVEMDAEKFYAFLATNHLSEKVKVKHRFGLRKNDQIVAVAGFSRACPYHRDGAVYQSSEMVRFCNLAGTTVVGGLSKLVKHAIRQMEFQDIMTYVDLDWGDGKAYAKLGFRETGYLPAPDIFVNLNNWERQRNQPADSPFALVAGKGSLKLNLTVHE